MFVPKNKEPRLSNEMKAIIDGSIDKGTSIYMDDIFRYKYKIMHMLIDNQDILNALHWDGSEVNENNVVTNGDQFKDICIFDFLKLPDLKDTVRNYICFEINDASGYENSIVKKVIFRVVSHEDDFKTDWGINRQDLLGSIIKNEFDWTNVFGMHLEKVIDDGLVTKDGYCYREIVYKTIVPNNLKNKNMPRY